MATMRGAAALEARWKRLPDAVRHAAQQGLESEVDALVDAEKRAAPVSELETNPGQLRESIEAYDTPGRPLSKRVIVGARDSKGRLFGRYVEFGHTAADGRYVPASPWFFPTYRARRKALRRRILAPARKVIRQMFPKVT